MFWRPFSFSPGVSVGTYPTWPFRQRFSIANVQKDCQNKKREIGCMPLENCPFLKIGYFNHFFPYGYGFYQIKNGDKAVNVNLFTVRHVCEGLWNGGNLGSGMRNSQSFKYSPVRVFLFYLSKIISHLR